MKKIICFLVLLFFVASSVTGAQTDNAKPATLQLPAALAGKWKGQLEYRDYSNDRRVKLPTLLEVRKTADNKTLGFQYTYDDGPGKTVSSSETVLLDLQARRYIVSDGKEKTEYRIAERKQTPLPNTQRLVLTGAGTENGKPVEVRKTITLTTNTLTILKETRVEGADFLFRNQYTFTRE